jgi:hypothetical protein
MKSRKIALRAAGVLLAAGTTAAAAQPAPVGTLTCTSMPSKERAAADAVLSCSFEGASGTKFQYAGALLRRGVATTPPGKRVYFWSVLGEREISSGADLAGRFVGPTGGESAGILSLGRDASIVLKPPVNTSQLGDNSAISVLELNLKAVRA